MEWLRMSQDGITQIKELNTRLELFEQTLEEIEIAIFRDSKSREYLLFLYP